MIGQVGKKYKNGDTGLKFGDSSDTRPFPTDNLVKIKRLRVENLLQTNCQFVCNHCSYEAE